MYFWMMGSRVMWLKLESEPMRMFSSSSMRHAAQLVEAVDRDERLSGAFTLAHLHEHVAAAGDDLRLGMLQRRRTASSTLSAS